MKEVKKEEILNNLFFIKPLIKKINENFYKNHQYKEYTNEIEWAFPLKEDTSIFDIHMIRGNLNDFTEDSESVSMLEDIILSNEGKLEVPFNSELGKSLVKKYNLAKQRVKSKLLSLNTNTNILISILRNNFTEDTYIVGGWVRDSISLKKSNDVDFCTSIPYDKLKKVLEDNGLKVKETGKQFLVLNCYVNGENFEIANLRKDKANEGAILGTIEEDAKRRDFTSSALYLRLKDFELLDPNGTAINDCLDNVLKFIGNPKERIKEDPLRTIRFYRFIGRGWIPDNKSLKAVRENFDYSIKNVSSTRIMIELEKITGVR